MSDTPMTDLRLRITRFYGLSLEDADKLISDIAVIVAAQMPKRPFYAPDALYVSKHLYDRAVEELSWHRDENNRIRNRKMVPGWFAEQIAALRNETIEEIAHAVETKVDGTIIQGVRTAQWIRTLKAQEAA